MCLYQLLYRVLERDPERHVFLSRICSGCPAVTSESPEAQTRVRRMLNDTTQLMAPSLRRVHRRYSNGSPGLDPAAQFSSAEVVATILRSHCIGIGPNGILMDRLSGV